MPDASPYQLINFFGLKNVDILQPPPKDYQIRNDPPAQQADPYRGRIQAPPQMPDQGLYKSPLNGPVMSDITLGDVDNTKVVNNSWTDAQGKTRSFTPAKFASVIITVNQAKQIVKTTIQGRDTGTVKEYIGMGDYEVTINGMICGPNGVYPKDDVTALKAILDAPIAIVVSGWYLQLLGIYNLVIESYDIGQIEGGYSYQPFSIKASSDTPVELKII